MFFNILVLTWERNFEVMFDIFSVLVFQISVVESYLDISFLDGGGGAKKPAHVNTLPFSV